MLYAWFSRRHLGNEVCWDSGHPSYRDKKSSVKESFGGRREEEQERSWSAGQQPAAAAILAGSAPVDGTELALVSCGTVNLETGGSSGRFEGTEQLGKGRNREKLRAAVAHLVNEQEARGTKMGRGEGGEVAGGML